MTIKKQRQIQNSFKAKQTKQNKTKQNKTKQNKIKQNKTKQNQNNYKTKQNKTNTISKTITTPKTNFQNTNVTVNVPMGPAPANLLLVCTGVPARYAQALARYVHSWTGTFVFTNDHNIPEILMYRFTKHNNTNFIYTGADTSFFPRGGGGFDPTCTIFCYFETPISDVCSWHLGKTHMETT